MLRCATITATLALASSAYAAVDPSLLAKIDAAARSTQTLSAEFTQKNRMKLFKQELWSKGRLTFRAPRQIRWQYLSPDPSLMILDGKQATMRSPGAPPQVFDLEKDATMRAIFDQLLTFVGGGSIAQIEVDYTVDMRGTATTPSLLLTPKAGSAVEKAFSRIELGFDAKTQVRQILLVEKNGDEKVIDFTKVERNGKIAPDSFR